MNRKTMLLKAAYDLLKQASDAGHVIDALAIEVKYGGVTCCGNCLMEDIADELGIDVA